MLVALGVFLVLCLTVFTSAKAATAVNLGNADNFAVLAGSFITATTPSVVSGDVGLSPAAGTFYTGLTTGMVTGTIYAVDATGPAGGAGNNPALLTLAKNDLTSAYTTAAAQGPGTTVTASSIDSFGVGTINNGSNLAPGVYSSGSTMGITGTLTLDGQGNPNSVFIFIAGSSLTTASASHIALINGAQPCNVFWVVGSSATFGTTSDFSGNVLAFSSITDAGGSTINGRLLARNAAVTLNNTHVIKATCVAPPIPQASNGGGKEIAPPLISVLKVPTPMALPSGPGPVTYNYTVTNIGVIAMSNVKVSDNKCSPVIFDSGDTNNDNNLDVNETWMYHCSTNLTRTTTNTVTATGLAYGWTAVDTANATVVVGLPVTPPLIHIVKRPNLFILPAGGGMVTYNYTVTNPGTAPLSNVSVIDDKCTGLPGRVVGHPGDLNHNDLLESNESWQFTCQSDITQTTTNTATAEGHANGLTALDFALATVAVSSPSLPNTGLPPESLALAVGALILASLVYYFYFVKRKNTV